MLVDPPIRDRFFVDARGKQRTQTLIKIPTVPFQNGYEDFIPASTRPAENDGPVHGLQRASLLDDLVYYWTKKLPSPFQPHAPTLLSMSYYPVRIIAAEWSNFANVIQYSLESLEYSTESLSVSGSDIQSLESSIRRLQSFRRQIAESLYKIGSLKYMIESLQNDESSPDTWNSLITDLQHTVTRLEIFHRRFDFMIPGLTSFIQLVESRRSFAETKSVTKLTYLALNFIPLTFVSGIFSMGGEFAPGKRWFWVYFAVGLPLMLIVFFIARR